MKWASSAGRDFWGGQVRKPRVLGETLVFLEPGRPHPSWPYFSSLFARPARFSLLTWNQGWARHWAALGRLLWGDQAGGQARGRLVP